MKKLLICLALLCIFPLIFSACFSKQNGGSDDPGDFADHGGEPMEFQRFSLSESGMSAQSYVYEGYKTETGVHLEHFIRSEYSPAKVRRSQRLRACSDSSHASSSYRVEPSSG